MSNKQQFFVFHNSFKTNYQSIREEIVDIRVLKKIHEDPRARSLTYTNRTINCTVQIIKFQIIKDALYL